MKSHLGIAILLSSALPLAAQIAIPPQNATPFRDTSMLKPPTGIKVAIVEFEDLQCPYCAYAAPIVRSAIKQYKIPMVHYDSLIPGHNWSRAAAINARYLEDKVSPKLAEDFRRDVFANQTMISNQDDLQNFTRKWFQSHNLQMPFLIDPSGRCAAEVQVDCDVALRLGIRHTPTILVVTNKEWIEVTSPTNLYAAIDRAESDIKRSPQPQH
jgi:protein-disulfide isomerase